MAKTEDHEARDLAEAIRIIEGVMIDKKLADNSLRIAWDHNDYLMASVHQANAKVRELKVIIAGLRQQLGIRGDHGQG